MKKVTSAVDVWAMGVLLFSLLTGDLPFNKAGNQQVKEHICEGNYTIPAAIAKTLSAEVKDAIKQMLDVNPVTRISTTDLMNHPWIADYSMRDIQLEA